MARLIQQPQTLESMAMENTGAWFALQAKKLTSTQRLRELPSTEADEIISKQIAIIRNHVERNVPGTFYNKMATKLIPALTNLFYETKMFTKARLSLSDYMEVSPRNAIGRIIETLFTANLTSLIFDNDSGIIFQDSLKTNWRMLSQLTRLELENSKEGDYIELFRNLHNLKHLKLLHVCTNEILQCIVHNCKHIETLDLSYNKNINDESAHIMSQLPNLKHIHINGSEITNKGLVELLISCKNIEEIDTITFNDYINPIQRALEDIAANEDHAGVQFNLKYYENDRTTTAEQISLVVKMCPQIHNLILMKHDDSQNYLHQFIDLQNLRELDLWGFQFHADRVGEFLHARGSGLVKLELEFDERLHLNDVMHICKTCPNLETLTIKNIYIYKCTNRSIKSTMHSEIEIPTLTYLKRLTVAELPDEQLILLLSVCPNIEVIDFRGVRNFSNNNMLEALDRNPNRLKYLNRFILRDKLSPFVIDRLVQNCVSPLLLVATHS